MRLSRTEAERVHEDESARHRSKYLSKNLAVRVAVVLVDQLVEESEAVPQVLEQARDWKAVEQAMKQLHHRQAVFRLLRWSDSSRSLRQISELL